MEKPYGRYCALTVLPCVVPPIRLSHTPLHSPQVPPNTQQTSHEPDHRPESHNRQRLQPIEETRRDEKPVDQDVRRVRQADGDEAAKQSLEGALQQEWAADE